jgi:hypothetical protein
MIETHAAGINVDGFGGAKVRGRDQAALMLLASVYTSPPFIGHLAQHHLENAHASRLSPFLTTELLRDLKERSV